MTETPTRCARCGYPLGDGERVYNTHGLCSPCRQLPTPRRPSSRTRTP